MRFRFCWDCDCPDWLLAEMLTLTKINLSDFSKLVTMVADSMVDQHFELPLAKELTSRSNLDELQTKSSIAAIRWILESSASSDTEARVLESELQQLGLPNEHCSTIRDLYAKNKGPIQDVFKTQSMKASNGVHWSYNIQSLDLGNSEEAVVQLVLKGPISDHRSYFCSNKKPPKDDITKLNILSEQVDVLLSDLHSALKHMKELKPGTI